MDMYRTLATVSSSRRGSLHSSRTAARPPDQLEAGVDARDIVPEVVARERARDEVLVAELDRCDEPVRQVELLDELAVVNSPLSRHALVDEELDAEGLGSARRLDDAVDGDVLGDDDPSHYRAPPASRA